MQLVLSEDQELLAKTAADFVAEKSPVTRMRALRDSADADGFSRALWKEMADLGWVGIPISEAHGGAGLGLSELAVVLEALGRTLAPEPYLSMLLGAKALELGGSDALQEKWLPGVAQGARFITLAHAEPGGRFDPFHIATRAERGVSGWRLSGRKAQVPDAHVADAIVVAARSAGAPGEREGITLFCVEASAPGVAIERQHRVDERGAALLTLEGVEVDDGARVGAEGEGGALLESVLDLGTAALCAEMLGGMSQVFDDTLDHLKQRQQFGVAIGTFQGLKHRAARVFMELELARSATMAAVRSLDEGSGEARKLVSLAKARCSDAYLLAANEAVQMFGGVGMTDEYDQGFYLKRARAAELSFGDAAWHRDRWALLSDY